MEAKTQAQMLLPNMVDKDARVRRLRAAFARMPGLVFDRNEDN